METSPPTNASSTQEQRAGFALFFAVTGLWTLWCIYSLLSLDTMVPPWGADGVLVTILSGLTVVASGYLIGKHAALIWLGLVPGAVMTAVGFLGINTDLVHLLWFSFALLFFGWPCYFLPLLGLGAFLRSRMAKRRLAPAPDLDSTGPTPQPKLHA